MKKLLAALLALVTGCTEKADSNKLGSNTDPEQQMLFASQGLQQQVKQMHLDGSPSPYQTIADAAKLVDAGKKNEAIAQRRRVLEMANLETRTILWAWSALRELGEKPNSQAANEVLGVVLEMPSGGAYDTLAAYVDGSARYLNFSGRAIFWDAPDVTVKGLCRALLDSTIPVSAQAKPRISLSLPNRGVQVTLLTRSGIFVISDPPDAVIGAGATLLKEMIKRAEQKSG
jgi:hypothetical protein